MSKYHNYSAEMLIEALEGFAGTTDSAIKGQAEVLLALKHLNLTHPLMYTPVLKWYTSIAEGRLSPRAALVFTGIPDAVEHIICLPIKDQETLAKGGTVRVADYDKEGNVVFVDKRLTRMAGWEMKMALTFEGVVRPFEEQKKILLARTKTVRRSTSVRNVRYDPATEEIIVGPVRISMFEISKAAGADWRIERTRAVRQAA